MSDLNPVSMETNALTSRRWLLRGGAVAAGAAMVAAASPRTARAADGGPVELGAENTSTSPTTVTIGADSGSTDPTLALQNADGPTLYLQPQLADYAVALEIGQIANTVLGPVLGVDSEFGATTTYLVTGVDLAEVPTPYPLPKPRRLLDTQTEAGRSRVIRTSPNAYDHSFRLKAGAWLDLEVAVEESASRIPGAFVNVTATRPKATGQLTVYPPGDDPGTSTVSFTKGTSIANSAFCATGIVLGRFAVRVRTTALTHVVLDLTGVSIQGTVSTPSAKSSTARREQHTPATAAAVRSRLRSTLAARVLDRLSR